VKESKALKDEGNLFFKNKEYQKAISKYARVAMFTKSLLPVVAGD